MQLSLPVLISGGLNIFVLSAFILLMCLISTRCPLALVPRSTVHSSVGCRQLTANFWKLLSKLDKWLSNRFPSQRTACLVLFGAGAAFLFLLSSCFSFAHSLLSPSFSSLVLTNLVSWSVSLDSILGLLMTQALYLSHISGQFRITT